jgi:hypothetical protein
MEALIEGRMCHYVAFNRRHLAAIVIWLENEESSIVDLAVFTNMLNVNNTKNFGIQFHQSIPFSAAGEPGTWHWIERA